jgi:hypothetical protein
MKKILCVIISALIIITIFSACSGSQIDIKSATLENNKLTFKYTPNVDLSEYEYVLRIELSNDGDKGSYTGKVYTEKAIEGKDKAGENYTEIFDFTEKTEYQIEDKENFKVNDNKLKDELSVHMLTSTKMRYDSIKSDNILENYGKGTTLTAYFAPKDGGQLSEKKVFTL